MMILLPVIELTLRLNSDAALVEAVLFLSRDAAFYAQ
jgi:hypothetical protein